MGTNARRLTLLVAPARHSTLQVAFAFLARENAVLVAYQGDATSSTPALHVWNGAEWLKISFDEYSTLAFLRSPPSQVVLVGDDDLLPAVLVDAAMANPGSRVMQIPSQDNATVINSLGQILNFSRSDWNWYAARYRLDLQDENASIRDRSWYDQPNTFRDREASPWGVSSGAETSPSPSTPMVDYGAPTVEPIAIPAQSFDYAPAVEPMRETVVVPPAVERIAPEMVAPIK